MLSSAASLDAAHNARRAFDGELRLGLDDGSVVRPAHPREAINPIGDHVQEKTPPGAAPRSPMPFPENEPNSVASVMALVEADFWKLRAQMLIYHSEVVAELDLLYETLYGTPRPVQPLRDLSRDSLNYPRSGELTPSSAWPVYYSASPARPTRSGLTPRRWRRAGGCLGPADRRSCGRQRARVQRPTTRA